MVKKASKRLISAIIALIASVLLCIGVCLAWFAVNNDVRGDGLQTQIKSNEVVGFSVTAYFLDYSESAKTYSIVNGNKDIIKDASGNVITVDYNGDTIINSDGSNKDVMRPFSLSGEYTTAVLFKIDYEILGSSENNFRIFAQCPDTSRITVEEVGDTDNFTSNLSNTVKFVQAQASDDAYGALTGKQTFVNELYEKSFHISLFDGINKDSLGSKNGSGNYEDTKYVIMDYDKDRFTYISSLLLESGGGLNSGLTLLGDITLGIEEYTNETVVPTSIAVDTLARDYETAYTQPMGTDVMSPKWQFVVTYSDGTKKVICGQNANLSIGSLNTTTVGVHNTTVTYTENDTPVTSDEFSYTIGLVITGGTGVAKNDTLELSAAGFSGDITWSVEDGTGSATITQEGKLTGVSEGTVTVTAKASTYVDDATTPYLKATYVVTVTAEKVAVTGVSLDKDSLSLEAGDTAVLIATVTPGDATNKAVSWSTSDDNVATVSGGVVRAVGEGTATITVTTKEKDAEGNPYTATCTVTVSAAAVPVESVTISGATEVTVGGTITLSASIYPANASVQTVVWAVIAGTGTATITQEGVLTGGTAGTVTVTATADGVSDSYTVNVKAVLVTAITLSKTSSALTVGSNETLTATITPDNATNSGVTWSSSDSAVATVDQSGKVTAVKEGTATITATAQDGSGVSASCAYTISKINVTSVTIDSSSPVTVTVGSTITLTATVSPSNATYNTVTWSVDDSTIATINSDGVLTGVKAGSVSVTATADGVTSAGYTVNVQAASGGEVTYTLTVDGTTPKVSAENIFTLTDMAYESSTLKFSTGTATVGISLNVTAGQTIKLYMKGYGSSSSGDSIIQITSNKFDTNSVTYTKSGSAANAKENTFTYDVSESGTVTFNIARSVNYTAKIIEISVTISDTASKTEYTVTFDMNGHGTSIDSMTTVDGKISAPTAPTADGYDFGGWYETADCTGTAIDFTTKVFTENTTVYAKWTATSGGETTATTYTYTYGGTNGSEWSTDSNDTLSSDDSPAVVGLKLETGSSTQTSLKLSASGNKATITLIGFTRGSSEAKPYVTVTFKDANGNSIGTLTGTTPAGKLNGNVSFTSDGVFQSATEFATIEFTSTSGKSIGVTVATIIVE
ncbi:MAG: Ig-like domain-containing protein [Candidatus Coproplasma sp.]